MAENSKKPRLGVLVALVDVPAYVYADPPANTGPKKASSPMVRRNIVLKLARHSDADGKDAYPSIDTIASAVGSKGPASHSTVHLGLSDLERLGFIRRFSRQGAEVMRDGVKIGRTNRYEVNCDAILRRSAELEGSRADSRRATAGLISAISTGEGSSDCVACERIVPPNFEEGSSELEGVVPPNFEEGSSEFEGVVPPTLVGDKSPSESPYEKPVIGKPSSRSAATSAAPLLEEHWASDVRIMEPEHLQALVQDVCALVTGEAFREQHVQQVASALCSGPYTLTVLRRAIEERWETREEKQESKKFFSEDFAKGLGGLLARTKASLDEEERADIETAAEEALLETLQRMSHGIFGADFSRARKVVRDLQNYQSEEETTALFTEFIAKLDLDRDAEDMRSIPDEFLAFVEGQEGTLAEKRETRIAQTLASGLASLRAARPTTQQTL